jgi:hypothetical protein
VSQRGTGVSYRAAVSLPSPLSTVARRPRRYRRQVAGVNRRAQVPGRREPRTKEPGEGMGSHIRGAREPSFPVEPPARSHTFPRLSPEGDFRSNVHPGRRVAALDPDGVQEQDVDPAVAPAADQVTWHLGGSVPGLPLRSRPTVQESESLLYDHSVATAHHGHLHRRTDAVPDLLTAATPPSWFGARSRCSSGAPVMRYLMNQAADTLMITGAGYTPPIETHGERQ